jgi:hypothetical protein
MHGTIGKVAAAQASATYVREMASVQKIIEDYVETGVAQLTETDMRATHDGDPNDYLLWRKGYRENRVFISSPFNMRQFVRRVAKDLNRPIVIAYRSFWGAGTDNTRVTIKKLKRHIPLVAEFFLTEGSYHGPVYLHKDQTNWYLKFSGEQGRKLYEHWYEQCRTNPEYRKALKII